MNATAWGVKCWTAIGENPVLERLFFASAELFVLAALVGLAGWWGTKRHPRLIALLWVVVMGKAVISLTVGGPFSFMVAPPVPVAESPRAAHRGHRAEFRGLRGNGPARTIRFPLCEAR